MLLLLEGVAVLVVEHGHHAFFAEGCASLHGLRRLLQPRVLLSLRRGDPLLGLLDQAPLDEVAAQRWHASPFLIDQSDSPICRFADRRGVRRGGTGRSSTAVAGVNFAHHCPQLVRAKQKQMRPSGWFCSFVQSYVHEYTTDYPVFSLSLAVEKAKTVKVERACVCNLHTSLFENASKTNHCVVHARPGRVVVD